MRKHKFVKKVLIDYVDVVTLVIWVFILLISLLAGFCRNEEGALITISVWLLIAVVMGNISDHLRTLQQIEKMKNISNSDEPKPD